MPFIKNRTVERERSFVDSNYTRPSQSQLKNVFIQLFNPEYIEQQSQFTRQSNPDVNSYIKQVRNEVATILTGETTNEISLERPPFTL